jgi:hypothetical protein
LEVTWPLARIVAVGALFAAGGVVGAPPPPPPPPPQAASKDVSSHTLQIWFART